MAYLIVKIAPLRRSLSRNTFSCSLSQGGEPGLSVYRGDYEGSTHSVKIAPLRRSLSSTFSCSLSQGGEPGLSVYRGDYEGSTHSVKIAPLRRSLSRNTFS